VQDWDDVLQIALTNLLATKSFFDFEGLEGIVGLMPRLSTRSGESREMSSPSNRIWPCRERWSPAMQANVVLLPAPLAPSSATISPAPTSSDTSRTAITAP